MKVLNNAKAMKLLCPLVKKENIENERELQWKKEFRYLKQENSSSFF